VTFCQPFLLRGLGVPERAGTYTVDTEEEQVDGLSVQAWKRVATTMQIARDGATEYMTIDPIELEEALRRDKAKPGPVEDK